jgi:hypothetical protein
VFEEASLVYIFVMAWEVAGLSLPLLLRLWDKLLTGVDELDSNTCAVSLNVEVRIEAIEMGARVLCLCKSERTEGKVVRMVGVKALTELLCFTDMGLVGFRTSEDGFETGDVFECVNVSVTVERVLDPEAVADVFQVRVLWIAVLGSCVCSMVVISAVVVW